MFIDNSACSHSVLIGCLELYCPCTCTFPIIMCSYVSCKQFNIISGFVSTFFYCNVRLLVQEMSNNITKCGIMTSLRVSYGVSGGKYGG